MAASRARASVKEIASVPAYAAYLEQPRPNGLGPGWRAELGRMKAPDREQVLVVLEHYVGPLTAMAAPAPATKPARAKPKAAASASQAMVVHAPAGAVALPDLKGWTNRFKVRSETSGNVYVIAQNEKGRYWGCSCAGWRTKRKCKHLEAAGLPSHMVPYELPGRRAAARL